MLNSYYPSHKASAQTTIARCNRTTESIRPTNDVTILFWIKYMQFKLAASGFFYYHVV